MKLHFGGVFPCVRVEVVVGALAIAAAWLLPLRGDEPARSMQGTQSAKSRAVVIQSLETRLRAQRFVVRKAGAQYFNARLAREIAEIEIQQYIECIFPQELANTNAEIKRSQSDLKQAEDRLDWLRRNAYKGFAPRPTTIEELGVKKARFMLEQALSAKLVLTGYTKAKRTRELNAVADKARGVEGAKQRAWELEKARQLAIEQQIAQWQPVLTERDEEMRSPAVHGSFVNEA